jgi:hypothetical protein
MFKDWDILACSGGGEWYKVAEAYTVEEGRAYLRATGRKGRVVRKCWT